ncbi:hypothetical protein OIE73_14045 [Streptomyces hirsutus]|uniref:Integral membrane protein n=1 Tax=Streptomyces hirsutus TaxID=35620 RepID=A0ABZ1GLJ6_9ACTN|nr:hypothetical protein [Streptomyces hirsutus]WSD06785.1 hypothetical protein OIE73_14045 [Streptomyces hirsutus]
MQPLERWGAPPAVNLILGVVAVVPLWLSMMFVVSYPLAGLGLTSREPTDNDGVLPWMTILILVWAVFLALWIPLNQWARPECCARRRYWATSAGLVPVPMTVLVVLSFLFDG